MEQLLIDYLIRRYPTAKRQTLKRMVEEGRVSVNDAPARKLKQPLAEADRVEVDERPAARGPAVSSRVGRMLRIVHEDADLLVANKPAGLLTSTVPREPRETLIALVRQHLAATDPQAKAGVIHRLDRDASGLLVFSKHHEAYRELKRQFFEHTVERVYSAITQGVPNPPAGEIQTSLVELPDGSVHSTRQHGKGQHAQTGYEVLRKGNHRALVRVTLFTGRKHQIRVHLSERGTPIVGDKVYGKGKAGEPLLLMAVKLGFLHPRTGKPVTFELPLPPEMEQALAAQSS
jgi:23S rRNA pseudouridine1911/1915/1917 synthase